MIFSKHSKLLKLDQALQMIVAQTQARDEQLPVIQRTQAKDFADYYLQQLGSSALAKQQYQLICLASQGLSHAVTDYHKVMYIAEDTYKRQRFSDLWSQLFSISLPEMMMIALLSMGLPFLLATPQQNNDYWLMGLMFAIVVAMAKVLLRRHVVESAYYRMQFIQYCAAKRLKQRQVRIMQQVIRALKNLPATDSGNGFHNHLLLFQYGLQQGQQPKPMPPAVLVCWRLLRKKYKSHQPNIKRHLSRVGGLIVTLRKKIKKDSIQVAGNGL